MLFEAPVICELRSALKGKGVLTSTSRFKVSITLIWGMRRSLGCEFGDHV